MPLLYTAAIITRLMQVALLSSCCRYNMNSCLFCRVYSVFDWEVGERHCECHRAK